MYTVLKVCGTVATQICAILQRPHDALMRGVDPASTVMVGYMDRGFQSVFELLLLKSFVSGGL